MKKSAIVFLLVFLLVAVFSSGTAWAGGDVNCSSFKGQWNGKWVITKTGTMAYRDVSIAVNDDEEKGCRVTYQVGNYVNLSFRHKGYTSHVVPEFKAEEGKMYMIFSISSVDNASGSSTLKFVIDQGKLVGELKNVREFDWNCSLQAVKRR